MIGGVKWVVNRGFSRSKASEYTNKQVLNWERGVACTILYGGRSTTGYHHLGLFSRSLGWKYGYP